MALLMLIILVMLLLGAYFCGNKKFLSPWFLLCAITLASFAIVLLNYNNWQVNINGKFVVYITSALLAFGAGTLLISVFSKERSRQSTLLSVQSMQCGRKYPVNLLLILSVAAAIGYIVKSFLDVGGFSLSFSIALRKMYDMRVVEDYSPGFIFNQMLEIVVAIAYVNTFRLLMKIYNKHGHIQDNIGAIRLIIPIIVMLFATVVSTDRNIFIRYGIYLVCMWMFFYYNNSKKKRANLRIMCMLVIFIAIAAALFFLMGKMKQYSSDFFKSISIYAGSGLYCFNLWIADYNVAPMWGASTFSQLITTIGVLLKPFGVDLHGTVNRIDPFIEFVSANGYSFSSNIYTALRPFVEDFGYFGVIIFPFIMGLFYQWLYKAANKSKNGRGWIIYCILIYPVIFFPILEQLFKRFHFGFIYEIAWPLIIYYFALRSKRAVAIKKRYGVFVGGSNDK